MRAYDTIDNNENISKINKYENIYMENRRI